MSRDVDNNEDILDSRDVIARIRELEDERESLSSDVDEANERLTDADNSEEYGSEESDAVQEAQDALDKARDALEEWDGDYAKELENLKALEAEAEGYGDWSHGAQLIRDSYFEQYARDTAEELYNVRDASWPYTCIDWEKAADELKQDYTSVTFDGVDYWMRS